MIFQKSGRFLAKCNQSAQGPNRTRNGNAPKLSGSIFWQFWQSVGESLLKTSNMGFSCPKKLRFGFQFRCLEGKPRTKMLPWVSIVILKGICSSKNTLPFMSLNPPDQAAEKCVFLQNSCIFLQKQSLPAEKHLLPQHLKWLSSNFLGAHRTKPQEIAGGLQGSRIRNASRTFTRTFIIMKYLFWEREFCHGFWYGGSLWCFGTLHPFLNQGRNDTRKSTAKSTTKSLQNPHTYRYPQITKLRKYLPTNIFVICHGFADTKISEKGGFVEKWHINNVSLAEKTLPEFLYVVAKSTQREKRGPRNVRCHAHDTRMHMCGHVLTKKRLYGGTANHYIAFSKIPEGIVSCNCM